MKHRHQSTTRSLRLRPRSRRRIDDLRYQGIAVALGELARAHMEPVLALMVLESLDLSVADLKNAGAEAYNVEALQDAKQRTMITTTASASPRL